MPLPLTKTEFLQAFQDKYPGMLISRRQIKRTQSKAMVFSLLLKALTGIFCALAIITFFIGNDGVHELWQIISHKKVAEVIRLFKDVDAKDLSGSGYTALALSFLFLLLGFVLYALATIIRSMKKTYRPTERYGWKRRILLTIHSVMISAPLTFLLFIFFLGIKRGVPIYLIGVCYFLLFPGAQAIYAIYLHFKGRTLRDSRIYSPIFCALSLLGLTVDNSQKVSYWKLRETGLKHFVPLVARESPIVMGQIVFFNYSMYEATGESASGIFLQMQLSMPMNGETLFSSKYIYKKSPRVSEKQIDALRQNLMDFAKFFDTKTGKELFDRGSELKNYYAWVRDKSLICFFERKKKMSAENDIFPVKFKTITDNRLEIYYKDMQVLYDTARRFAVI